MEEAVSEEVRRRLVPREEEEDAVRDDLVVRQVIALVLGAEHEAHEVVSRASLALAEEGVEVVDEPGDAGARLDEVVALVDRAAEIRREPVRPRLDRLEVLSGAPINPAMTIAGRGKASSRMKSIAPRATTRSRSASTVLWMRSRLDSSCRGVKELWSSARRRS